MIISIAPFSGALINPARALGPVLILDEQATTEQLVMMICPFLACSAAVWLYRKLLISEDLEDELEEL